MPSRISNFPFTAVTGQELFKLALILVAVNPAIGGVLISGPRGSAKSTLSKGLADVMPEVDAGKTPTFVTLPLSVTEEMVVGTLNLQQVLNEKKVEFQNGLLAKADQGVLYVDEVNLLQDHIVDLLLDVASSGINVVERDGISHSHDAQFILLGTMNPDEGELRPQLQDRFGLSVELGNEYDIAERIEIVQQREKFDADNQAFLERYKEQQDTLKADILTTRELLSKVECSDDLQELIARKCHDARVDGLRADIVWYRAAIAHAALHKRLTVAEEDIIAVEELVLNHRRQSGSNSPKSPDANPNQPQKPFSRPNMPDSAESKDQTNDGNTSPTIGDWGKMDPQDVSSQYKAAEGIDLKLPIIDPKQQNRVTKKRSQRISAKSLVSDASGQTANKGKQNQDESTKVNWLSSLLASAGQWPLRQLAFYRTKKAQTVLHIVLIDTSASTLNNNLFAQAKAVVLHIAEQAYLDREQLSIIGFGNQTVETLLPRQRAPKALRKLLDSIPAAGGTPLREALEHAVKLQQQQLRQTPNMRIKTYIITDGKMRQSFSHIDLDGEITLIDIEKSTVKRGKGQRIANDLNAAYVPLYS